MRLEFYHFAQDQLLSNIPEDHQEDPGEVVAVVPNPLEADQVIIGYSTGFMMLWDTASRSLLNILKSSTLLRDLCWRSEDEFYSCHTDGSFTAWDAENGAQLQVRTRTRTFQHDSRGFFF